MCEKNFAAFSALWIRCFMQKVKIRKMIRRPQKKKRKMNAHCYAGKILRSNEVLDQMA